MSEHSKIQWTQHTGGPWFGCTEVSSGCANCYARELLLTRLNPIVRRAYKAAGFEDWETRPVWGNKAVRVLSKGFWKDAYRWDREAAKRGVIESVFPSMIDWLDEMPAGIIDQDGKWLDANEVRARFLRVISETLNLRWLLLTKRPEMFISRIWNVILPMTDGTGNDGEFWQWLVDWHGGKPPSNVWFGTSVENQKAAEERIPCLLKIPAKVRFLSVEPMLGPIEFSDVTKRSDAVAQLGKRALSGIHWVIFGGESGPGARPCNIEWIRDGVKQCRAAGVKVFVKQLGSLPVQTLVQFGYSGSGIPFDPSGHPIAGKITDKKGGDMAEWPVDLRVREFPTN